ncbi:transcriptional regulator [Polymorphospora lycopeni]|uniref:Transcriptional regulator n=1 Tax=Polymorphospora lycopeni TaxID=3140240 RepID=A0ABV5CT87_9ACTN
MRSGDSPRLNGVDAEHVRILADVETDLPPVIVHEETMTVIDGMHRVAAAWMNGRTEIDAILVRSSLADAFRLAVQANVEHGLPLTPADRRAAAERIVRSHPQLSDRAIAGSTGLAARTVAAIRHRTAGGSTEQARLGRDGRVRPLSTAQGRLIAGSMIVQRPDASLREIARAAGVSVGTARDVRARVSRGEDPVPAAQRVPPAASEPPVDPVSPARGGARTDGAQEAVDVAAVLDGLRSDPSLRYSDSGRALLRWLTACATAARWRDSISAVPPHCTELVAKVVRECTRACEDFTEQLEHWSTE